jgi:hypothetical protein
METAFALLYWPAAGVLFLLLVPNKTNLENTGQNTFVQIIWLMLSVSVAQAIGSHLHPTNTALRVFCSPHGTSEHPLHYLMMLSAVIPLLVWKFIIRDQIKQQKAFPQHP